MESHKGINRFLFHVFFMLAIFIISFSGPAIAEDKYWIGTTTDYNWYDGSNWRGGAEPDGGEDVYLTWPQEETKNNHGNRGVLYNPSYSELNLNILTIDSGGGYTIRLYQGQDNLSHYLGSYEEVVGIDGKGTHDHSKGNNNIERQLYLGGHSGGQGSYILSGSGALTVGTPTKSGTEYVGYYGKGLFTHSGGQNITDQLILGEDINSEGIYSLSGSGSLTVKGEMIGASGKGYFTQNGGQHTVNSNDLYLGNSVYGEGTYNLSSGTLTVSDGDEFIGGHSGTGIFEHSGGQNSINNGWLVVGGTDGSYSAKKGTYTLSQNGQLTSKNESIGYGESGQFFQTGGVNTISENLWVKSRGSYELSGNGKLSAKAEHITNGIFTQSGGQNTISSNLLIAEFDGDSGSYNLNGPGILKVEGNEYIGDIGIGTINHSAGQHTVDTDLYLGKGSSGEGTYSLSGNGTLTVEGNEYIGDIGIGAFNHSGGHHSVEKGVLLVGHSYDSEGNYILSNSGTLKAKYLQIGTYGKGDFLQTGGDNYIIEDLVLTSDVPTYAQYRLGGNGRLSAYDENIGGGVFYQGGGENEVRNKLIIGSGGAGYYTLLGGELKVANIEDIGWSSTGGFLQTGGTHKVNGLLRMGSSGGKGAYYLRESGYLETIRDEIIGSDDEGYGKFDQDGGHHKVKDDLRIYGYNGGIGTYNLSSGILEVGNRLDVGLNGEMFLNGGSVKANILDIAEATTFTFLGGVLKTYSVVGDLTNKGGTLAPGASPGLLTVEGDYAQEAAASLMIELGGLIRGDEYDAMIVNGDLSLAGNLDVVWWDGFTASLDNSFDLLDWTGSLIGTFDNINLPVLSAGLFWDASGLYLDGTILVTDASQPVPEPATMLLLGSGLIGFAGFSRKFRKIRRVDGC